MNIRLATPQHRFFAMAIAAATILMTISGVTHAREWSDESGHYHFVGNLIARNGDTVVIETEAKKLVSVKIKKLSSADREYLSSLPDEHEANVAKMQTWHLRGGSKIEAAVVEYGQRDVTIQRRRNRVYVNDKPLSNLPEFQQDLIPKIVSHFEKSEAPKEDLKKWVKQLHGQAKKYTVDGVMMEFENGDLYGIPFFILSAEDRALLEPGWKAWLDAKNDRQKEKDHQLELRTMAAENREETMRQRRVQQLQLQLAGYQAGLFDLWEVGLAPQNQYGVYRRVVVPARDSATATAEALRMNPGYTAGAVVRVNRRF